MSDVAKHVDVNVPVRTAYNQWTQFEQFPNFMEGVESVQQLDNLHLHWRAKIAGQAKEWDAVITEQTPDELIAWRSISGAENSGMVTFERITPDKTRVTLRLQYEPEGALESAGDAIGFVSARVQGDLHRFKEFIEGRKVETGAWRGQVDETTMH
jgi:uncharacterized membrane protein